MKLKKTRKVIIAVLAAICILLPGTDALATSGDTELHTMIERFMRENEATTAAVSIAVFNYTDVIFEQAYGYINIAEEIPNDFNAVFEWGSVTKLLLPVSAMQLTERGMLDLNASIHTYLPDGFLTKLNSMTRLP